MNGDDEAMMMEMEEEEAGSNKESLVFMWGYLPGALPQRSPLLSPVVVRLPESVGIGDSWKDVCGGGCGFAMAITESGKLITWGSTDDMGQSYVTSGKHGETPEPFPLPTEASMVKAAAGWAHCISVTEPGDIYTWGWKECVPTGKVIGDQPVGGSMEMDQQLDPHSSLMTEQASPRSQGSRSTNGAGFGGKGGGVEGTKRRRMSSAKQAPESSTTGDEILSALPCLVTLSPGVRIVSVSAGGRHTLALSDMGQVWGWGYGGEGQLGLGSRIRMVSSPHPIPCIEPSAYGQGSSSAIPRGGMGSEEQVYNPCGTYVTGIACGGRHSAVITGFHPPTDAGAVLTFGWGLYGQCGQGSTDDELSPTCVSSLLGIRIQGMAAGLWHTVCISAEGDVYAFGGNQFGQLGTGADTAEVTLCAAAGEFNTEITAIDTLPRLLEAPSLESEHAKLVSCGARHSAILTDDGKVFCWGWNKYGQLGLGDVIDRNIPSQVPFEGCLPKNVACGWWHTLVLAESPI